MIVRCDWAVIPPSFRPDQGGDHARAGPGLARPGRPLDREHALIEIEGQAKGGHERVLAVGPNAGRAPQRPQAGRTRARRGARGRSEDPSPDRTRE